MTKNSTKYDGTLRVVIWLDLFWSVVAVLVSAFAWPAVALLDVPRGVESLVGGVAIGAAIFLAATGAITGVLLMLRLNAGHYLMPDRLALPLPRIMRPDAG